MTVFQVHFIRDGEVVCMHQSRADSFSEFCSELTRMRSAESRQEWDDVRVELSSSPNFLLVDASEE